MALKNSPELQRRVNYENDHSEFARAKRLAACFYENLARWRDLVLLPLTQSVGHVLGLFWAAGRSPLPVDRSCNFIDKLIL